MNDRDAQVALAGAIAALAVQEKWAPEYADAVMNEARGKLVPKMPPRVAVSDLYRAIALARAGVARSRKTVATADSTLAGLEHE